MVGVHGIHRQSLGSALFNVTNYLGMLVVSGDHAVSALLRVMALSVSDPSHIAAGNGELVPATGSTWLATSSF